LAFEDPTRHPLLVLSDLTAVGGAIATFFSWVPPAVGLVSLIWLGIQIWESNTVQKAMNGWRHRHQERRLAILRAKAKVTAALIAAIELQREALDAKPRDRVSQDPASDKS
jgi:hypothetical protein